MTMAVLLMLYCCYQLTQEVRSMRNHSLQLPIIRSVLYGIGVLVSSFWIVKVCWSANERKEIKIKSIRPITSKIVQ